MMSEETIKDTRPMRVQAVLPYRMQSRVKSLQISVGRDDEIVSLDDLEQILTALDRNGYSVRSVVRDDDGRVTLHLSVAGPRDWGR